MTSTFTAEPILISVVICAYNEQDALLPLIDTVRQTLNSVPYELIVVDDGSTDQTLPRLRQHGGEPLTIVELSRNFGQSAALAAGLARATGAYVATLDGDGQNDPEDLPRMLHLARSTGADLVAGIRAKRQDGWLLRRLPSQLANRLICRLTGINHPDFGCTLKLFTRELVQRLPLYGDKHRFIPALAKAEGARIVSMPVRHHPRLTGQSHYGLSRVPRVLGDLVFITYLLHYQNRPMHAAIRVLIVWLGLAGLSVGLLGAGIGMLGTVLALATLFGLLASGLLGLAIGADLALYRRYQSQQAYPFIVRRVYQQTPVPV